MGATTPWQTSRAALVMLIGLITLIMSVPIAWGWKRGGWYLHILWMFALLLVMLPMLPGVRSRGYLSQSPSQKKFFSKEWKLLLADNEKHTPNCILRLEKLTPNCHAVRRSHCFPYWYGSLQASGIHLINSYLKQWEFSSTHISPSRVPPRRETAQAFPWVLIPLWSLFCQLQSNQFLTHMLCSFRLVVPSCGAGCLFISRVCLSSGAGLGQHVFLPLISIIQTLTQCCSMLVNHSYIPCLGYAEFMLWPKASPNLLY